MIETYGRASQRSTFQYLDRDLVVSFKAADFTRVFGIPGPQGKKVQPKKISKDGKLFLIRLVCGDLSEAEQAALAETSKGRGLKKTDIQEWLWRCLMDLVKSRLTGSSRASGKVYDWAFVLAERMHEFMTLQHKTFYMPHYTIGLFLDAAAQMIPMDELEAKPGPLAPGEPPIMRWKHLDTATGQKGSAAQKRPRMDMAGDTDNGRQETSFEEVSVEEEEGEGEDDEVQVVTATPLLFPCTTVPVTPGLVPAGLHMAHIPGFGQTRRSILMTGVSQLAITLAAPCQHGVWPSPVRPAVGFAVGFAQSTAPVTRETSSTPAEALPVATPVAPAISQPVAIVIVAQSAEV